MRESLSSSGYPFSIQLGSFKRRRARTVLFLLWYPLVPYINLDAAVFGWLQINLHWQAVPLVVVPFGTTNLAVFTIRCRELSRRGGWLRHQCQSIARKATKPR